MAAKTVTYTDYTAPATTITIAAPMYGLTENDLAYQTVGRSPDGHVWTTQDAAPQDGFTFTHMLDEDDKVLLQGFIEDDMNRQAGKFYFTDPAGTVYGPMFFADIGKFRHTDNDEWLITLTIEGVPVL